MVALDARRSWVRSTTCSPTCSSLAAPHRPGRVTALHSLAARWFAGNGYPVEAIRHAQAARDWGLAARLLADHWFGLDLDGQAATTHELLAGFPADALAADAELGALAAADELAQGSLEEAERYLGLAARGSVSVPADRRVHLQLMFAILRLALARRHGNLPRWSKKPGGCSPPPGPRRGAARPRRGAARAGAEQIPPSVRRTQGACRP